MKLHYLLLTILIIGCSSKEQWHSATKDITIMTYNVENLFDTVHDAGKNDYTYLPKAVKEHNPQYLAECASLKKEYWRKSCLNTNWSPKVLQEKMRRLADVILKVKNGRGPDLLLLEEVENINVLTQLSKTALAQGNYTPVLIEGPDERGIDTALLTRLPVEGKPKLHTIHFNYNNKALRGRSHRPTRGILEVTVKLPTQDLLTIFVCHFPSQGGPTELRRQALYTLQKLTARLPKERMIIIGGDFNITHNEDIKNKLLATYIAPYFDISHHQGLFNEPGTESYHGHWSFLDMLFFSKNMRKKEGTAPWFYRAESLRIPKSSIYQVSRFYTPNRFNAKSAGGVSDHYPVVVDITPRQKTSNLVSK